MVAPPTISRPPIHPSFWRALQGAWLLHFKSRFSWRRMPILLASLLILPVLIYATTSSRQGWTSRQSWLGQPLADVLAFNSRLARDQHQLRPEQSAQISQIFREEYARTEAALGEIQSGEDAAQQRIDEVRACYARIRERARPLLDESQYPPLRSTETRKLASLARRPAAVRTRTAPFHRWLIDFYVFVILPISCVAACGPLIREEVQANTVGFLITRPLTRARLVMVKFVSHTAGLQIIMLVQALLIFAAGTAR